MKKLFGVLGKVFIDAFRVDDPPRNPYPQTVAECLDDNLKYKSGTEEAIKDFRMMNPYRGSPEEKQVKFRMLNTALAKVYEIDEPRLVFVDRFPAGPCCFPTSKPAVIMMEPSGDGDYSVVAFLHEFAHTLGKGEKGACTWSLNLFKRYWPKSFEKLEPRGHMLYKKKKATST